MGQGPVTIRFFGSLHADRTAADLPTTIEVDVAADGITARELADLLELDADSIEGVFCNHTVFGLEHIVRPGDRVAFVPPGTPGPHRVFLGLHAAGRGERP